MDSQQMPSPRCDGSQHVFYHSTRCVCGETIDEPPERSAGTARATVPQMSDVTAAETFEHLMRVDAFRLHVEQYVSDSREANRADCHDCGLGYGEDGWIECIVPNDAWNAISPSGNEGGILCITCIARRLKRAGFSDVPVMLCGTEAIRVADQNEAYDRGWQCAERRIQELENQLAASPTESGHAE